MRYVRYQRRRLVIFPRKFSSSDDIFVYYAGDNNVVGLVQPIPDISDKPKAYMEDEDVVDTIGDEIL